MIISKMHWLFKERYNRNSSNYYPDFSPMQIDQFINDAVEIALQQYGVREDKQMFFDMLSPLLTSVVLTSTNNSFQLPENYFYSKRIVADTDCGLVKVIVVGHGKLNDVLNDAFQKPSKRWGRIIGVFNDTGLQLYADHEISAVNLEYYRAPTPVFFGGYDTLEYLDCVRNRGNCAEFYSRATEPKHCDVAPAYHARIVDMAVREAQRTLAQQEITLTQDKIISSLN